MTNFYVCLNILIPLLVKIFIPDGRYGLLTLITDFVFLPLILLLVNVILVHNRIIDSFLKAGFWMMGGLLIGDLTGFFIWGLTTKRLLTPDAETLWILQRLMLYHIVFCSVCIIVNKVSLTIFKLNKNTQI